MYLTAVVLAAGRGLRLKSKISKPLIKIGSRPLIVYCLQALSRHPCIRDIIVVANRRNSAGVRNTIKQYRIRKIKGVVLGGQARQDSAAKGLKSIDKRTSLVLIHDAVRPFIDKQTVSSVIEAARARGAAIVGVPVKATIKKVRGHGRGASGRLTVEETLNRENLWEIQTPQVFRKDLILKAYKKFGRIDVTDDAMLVERLGVKVGVVPGTYRNIKITTPEDLVIARSIAKDL